MEMLRGIGSGMILAGCLGLGLWYRGQLRGRIQALRQLVAILDLFCSEVGYGRSTLPECCRRLAGQVPEPFGESLGRIGEIMEENRGKAFAEVFREYMEEPLGTMSLRDTDREVFLGAVPQMGFVDGQMQLKVMESSRERLSSTIGTLEQENAQKCRMAVGLGAMGGQFLLLILL